MKRISIITLSFAVATLGFVSCGKTTKRKLAGDWKVSSYYEQLSFTAPSGDYGTNTLSMTETEVTSGSTFEPTIGQGSTESHTGSVVNHEFVIKKDGTWSMVRDVSYGTGNSAFGTLLEQSGTWSFLTKNTGDDFEKNERVHFNILKSHEVLTNYSNGSAVFSSANDEIYLTGEKVVVYTIKESKKDELQMELENKYSFTQTNGNNNSHALVRKMTLIGK